MLPTSRLLGINQPGGTMLGCRRFFWIAAILVGLIGSIVGFGPIEAATAVGGNALSGQLAGGSAVPPKPPGGNCPPARQGQQQGPKEKPRPSQPPTPVSPIGSKNGRKHARSDQEQGAAEAVPGAELATDTRHEARTPSIGNATESTMGATADPDGRRVGRGRISWSLESPLDPESPDTEDEAWLEHWRAHKDEVAFAWFIARYGPCLLAQARRFADWHQAQDIVHETFLYLWEVDPAIRSTAHLVALLRRVTHNLGVSFRRKATRVELVDPKSIDGLHSQFGAHGAEDDAELWEDAARWLTDDQVQLLRLRYEKDLSYQQIAALKHLTLSQVRQRLHAAKRRWQKKRRS